MQTETISVMIVEQQPMMRTALSTTFTSAGMKVLEELKDGKEAIERASKLTPSLIIYSIRVPSLEDLQCISNLRNLIPSTRILALVTGEFRGQINAALDYGAHRVLTKTAHRTEIINTVRAMAQ